MEKDWEVRPCRIVEVTATVTFTAYVFADNAGDHGRMAYEIADAVEYRAVHANDSEDDDVLVALVDGGSGNAATVTIDRVTDLGDAEQADVIDAVEHTGAWL